MTYVIRHKPTGLFIGFDGDHIKAKNATQYDSRAEAGELIQYHVNPVEEFEVVENVNCPLKGSSDDQ